MKLSLICEGYGRTLNTSYHGVQVTDPRPDMLVLGRFVNHLGNKLLCGINLNYLTEEQILRLRTNLAQILADRNVQRRVRQVRALMPDVFNRSYRTYMASAVNVIRPGTLRFYQAKSQESDAVKGGEQQKPVQHMPIKPVSKEPGAKPAEPTPPAAPAKPGGAKLTGSAGDQIKKRHADQRGETEKKAKDEVEKADQQRRADIEKDLEDRVNNEVEKSEDGKIGTDDLDKAFEEGEEEQDSGPRL